MIRYIILGLSKRLHILKIKRCNKIGKKVLISHTAAIGKKIRIANNAIIGQDVEIDDNVCIGSRTTLERIRIHSDSRVESGVVCTGTQGGKIKIGSNSYIGLYNILDHSDDIIIGDFVHIAGPSTGLWTHKSYLMVMNSVPLDKNTEQFRPTAPITIEDNVYIGGNCTIYPGVKIGHHSIVAPNSAVTKDVPPFSMVGGVPAKFIKNTHEMIEKKEEDKSD